MKREAWMTKPQLASELQVSVRTVERLRLPCTKVGGQNRYFLSEVRAALNDVPETGGNVIPLRPRHRGVAA